MRALHKTVAFALLSGSSALTAAATAADFNGVWKIQTPVTHLMTANGEAPPLLPSARKVYEQRTAQLQAGDRSYDSTLRCKPMGEPRTAYDPDGGPFEILVNPQVVVFAYTWNRMIRFAYTKEKIEAVGPSYYGTASAHWDQGALIVNAHDFHDSTLLDAAGMPHSEQLKLTEHYSLSTDGSTLRETILFDDPKTFSKPWQARLTFSRMSGAHIQEDVCVERLGIHDY